MSALVAKVEALLDSTPFLIFFAIWTGVYLVQIVKKDQGAPPFSELWWVLISFAVAFFIV